MMKLNTCKFILSLIVMVCIPAYLLAGDDAEAIVKKLQKKYDSINDAAVVFTQNVQFGVMKTVQSFDGKLFMKKGKKYRIELEHQTIVTDGKSVWSVNSLNKQVVIDKYRDDPKTFSPEKILVNIPDDFNPSLLGKESVSNEEILVLKLMPKNKKTNIRWMKVWINEDDFLMKKIQLLDVSDNLTTYSVKEIKINQSIPDDRFRYEAPADIEVIDLR